MSPSGSALLQGPPIWLQLQLPLPPIIAYEASAPRSEMFLKMVGSPAEHNLAQRSRPRAPGPLIAEARRCSPQV